MIEKTPLCPKRVRKIKGSFAFIEHRFLSASIRKYSHVSKREIFKQMLTQHLVPSE